MNNLTNELPRLKVAGTEEEMVPGPQLAESLRCSGYSYWTAIDELVDNSEDASANVVKVDLYSKGKLITAPESKRDIDCIVVADDGRGMNEEELRKCHQLGSVREYKKHDIGKFGMGGIVGSINIGRKVMTVTRKNGATIGRLTDMDIIADRGRLVSTGYVETQIPDSYLQAFNSYLGSKKSGTCVFLEKLDKMSTTRFANVRKKLKTHLGLNYFSFLAKETLAIEVNDERINYQHPIHWTEAVDESRLHESEFQWTDSTGTILDFTLQVVDLTNVKNASSKGTQGGYFVRNGRLLCGAITDNDECGVVGFWKDHADYRHVRWMIQFTSEADEAMGVGFQKKSIRWNKSLNDKVASIVKPYAKSVAAIAGKKQKLPVAPLNDQVMEIIKKKLNKTKGSSWDVVIEDMGQYGEATENQGTLLRFNEEHISVKELLNDPSRYSKESGFYVLAAVEKSFAETGASSPECEETLKRLHKRISTNLASMSDV